MVPRRRNKMNEEAANALLKTLEEPPEFTHFILDIGDADRLLPTIRSRCCQIASLRSQDEDVAKYLIKNCALRKRKPPT